jgi:hypothetical protein
MHITGAGTYIVIASQAGITNHAAVPDTEHIIIINRAATTTTAVQKPACKGEA